MRKSAGQELTRRLRPASPVYRQSCADFIRRDDVPCPCDRKLRPGRTGPNSSSMCGRTEVTGARSVLGYHIFRQGISWRFFFCLSAVTLNLELRMLAFGEVLGSRGTFTNSQRPDARLQSLFFIGFKRSLKALRSGGAMQPQTARQAFDRQLLRFFTATSPARPTLCNRALFHSFPRITT